MPNFRYNGGNALINPRTVLEMTEYVYHALAFLFYVYDYFNGFCGFLAKIIKNLDLIHDKEAFPVTSLKIKIAVFKMSWYALRLRVISNNLHFVAKDS